MGEQSVRQTARRAALDAQATKRAQRAERERRLSALGVAVMVAIGERDARVAACERRAGAALRTMTDQEGLTMREAIDWCGPNLTVREAARLRGLGGSQVADDTKAGDGEQPAGPSVALPATGSADGAPPGVTGSTGSQGDPGAKGDAGIPGAPGQLGLTGGTGPQGATGAKGDTGIAGARGQIGLTGGTGPQGATGAQGNAGNPGASGQIGLTGSTGSQGAPGAKGDVGPAGPKGDAGFAGGSLSYADRVLTITSANFNGEGIVYCPLGGQVITGFVLRPHTAANYLARILQ